MKILFLTSVDRPQARYKTEALINFASMAVLTLYYALIKYSLALEDLGMLYVRCILNN